MEDNTQTHMDYCCQVWENISQTTRCSDPSNKIVDNIYKYHELQHGVPHSTLATTYIPRSDSNKKEIPKQKYQVKQSAYQEINNNNERPTKQQRSLFFNCQRSQIVQTDKSKEESLTEGGEKIKDPNPYFTRSYNNMQYYMAMIANIHSMMQNILSMALRNSKTELGNNFQENFCPYDYQAILYCLAYQQRIQHVGLAELIQTSFQDYTGPEQTEPLDLSQKKSSCKVAHKENHTNYKSIKKNQEEDTDLKQKSNVKALKCNISKQIIEYNWNKKKNIQRRRFKLRKCQRDNTKQKTPVMKEVIIEDQSEKTKLKRRLINKTFNVRESKRMKVSETEVTVVHDVEQQIGSNSSYNLVQTGDGEDSKNVSLAHVPLKEGLKVLLCQEGVYYPAILSAVAPPDIYGVRIVNRRGNKPLILAREQLISQAVQEKKPASLSELKIGSHVCAIWSNKFTCLYPGTVVSNHNLVTVQFDDGDCRDCNISDIRYLPEQNTMTDRNFGPGLSVARQNLVAGISTDYQTRIGEQSCINKIPKNEKSRKNFSKLKISVTKNAWAWADGGFKPSKRSRIVQHDTIEKDGETVSVGDAVFLHSADSGGEPYIGRVDRLWETSTGKMKVLIRWLYHAHQVEGVVQGGGRVQHIKTKGALFESNHCDENFVSSIHKPCKILSLAEVRQSQENNQDLSEVYHLAGEYQPVEGIIILRD